MWQEHTDLRATRYLQACSLVDLVSLIEVLANEGSKSLSSSLQSLPRTLVNTVQEQNLPASVFLEVEGKLDSKRFCRYWTSEYNRWLHSRRQPNLKVRCCEGAAANALATAQQTILHNLEDWTPAEMTRVITDYWNEVRLQPSSLAPTAG